MILANKCILEDIGRLHSFSSTDDCYALLRSICNYFDIEKVALAMFFGNRNITEKFSVFHSYPQEWANRYNTSKYQQSDPIFQSLTKISMPFVWRSEEFQDISHVQKNILYEAHDFGIDNGTTIPLIPHKEFQGFLTILDKCFLHPEVIYLISIAANLCTERIVALQSNPNDLSHLTNKEIEILELKSRGIPNKKLTYELGVSLATINFHLKNIRKKLDAISTEQALLKFSNTLR